VCSADHFFASGDAYAFDGALLPQAHQACLLKFVRAVCLTRAPLVIVDNTNCQVLSLLAFLVQKCKN
jgi:hypothetical protein